ncbi:threonyl-tRNA synthetase [Cavenderia fasciculata]|uniref:threonine--tRNA ligase n=1 Tax=Cavenderia fasciculata TaxID=261658 RepID=F4PJC7_CACFS|nr:threonyl-tRNA synthetase [Cavenderia fasciculata]EGG24413.1 threonyl-tRNA synthetase [Cavenderia fasciculata]|eukprot:XP_004362264.1 threonyl-tRNA synthetase [Cavenderia fasciculata]
MLHQALYKRSSILLSSISKLNYVSAPSSAATIVANNYTTTTSTTKLNLSTGLYQSPSSNSCTTTPLLNSSSNSRHSSSNIISNHHYYCSSASSNSSNNNNNIDIGLPDGRKIEGKKGESTPLIIASSISKSLAKSSLLAKLDGIPLSLTSVLEHGGSLELLDFESEEGRRCFWYSSSIVLAMAMRKHILSTYYNNNQQQQQHQVIITANQANITKSLLLDGFQADIYLSDTSVTIKETDVKSIKKIMDTIVKENNIFKREKVSKQSLIDLLNKGNNKYGLDELENIKENEINIIRVAYKKNGDEEFIVICNGQDNQLGLDCTLPSTGYIKAFDILRNSAVVGSRADMSHLQRLAGISFPSNSQLDLFREQQELAAQLDHRNIGREQELFFFHPYSPGSCFFLPHGAKVYNKLLSFLRGEYRRRGYQEVITPNIYSQKLWEVSGHWQNYKDNMFSFQCDHTTYSLKPMNCPGHCLMYAHRVRSYKELPMRYADFGVLHRNETHGSLTGLTRVRRFQQDDAHIFCRTDQIEEEMRACLDFLQYVYRVFGFTFSLELSTRPKEGYLGDLDTWNRAENALEQVLNESFRGHWRLNEGDGAFYGPKIDIHIKDANGRSHQCATIQLDFQLPQRFNLEFTTSGVAETDDPSALAPSKFERPVMIHRAIFGSTERMLAILIEHTKGKWPFWLSPRQVLVTSIGDAHNEYAEKIRQDLHLAGYEVDIDTSAHKTIKKKLRDAIILKYNYVIVVGNEEVTNNTVSVRRRDGDSTPQSMSLSSLLDELQIKTDNYQ